MWTSGGAAHSTSTISPALTGGGEQTLGQVLDKTITTEQQAINTWTRSSH